MWNRHQALVSLSVSLLLTIWLSIFVIPIQIPTVYATNYESDNFESFPTWWSPANGGGGSIGKSGEVKHGGSYSGYVNTTGGGTPYAYASNTTTQIINNFHQSIWIYPPSGVTERGIRIMQSYNGSSVGFGSGLLSNSTGYYLYVGDPTATHINVTSISANAWSFVEFYYYIDGKLGVWVNGAKIGGNWTTGVNSNNRSVTFYIGDVSGTGTQYDGKLFYDDLILESPTTEPGGLVYDLTKVGQTSTEANATWTLYSYWYGIEVLCSGFIFSYNYSGSVSNDTWVSFPDTNNTWANVSKTINLAVGNAVNWTVYANSSLNGWTVIPFQVITVTATVVFQYVTGGTLARNETVLTNGTSTVYNTLSPHLDLMSLANTTYTFLNLTWSYGSSVQNPCVFTVVNATTIWGYFDYFNSTYPPPIQYAIARFDFTPANPIVNQAILFNSSQSYTTSTISQYGWSWDDGSSDLTASTSLSHIFTSTGLYNVTLNVTDSGATLSNFTFHLVNVTVDLYASGYTTGWTVGNASGYAQGYSVGYALGWDVGNASGYADGYLVGWGIGNATGWLAGNSSGYSSGWISGNGTGWASGNSTGWIAGNSTGWTAGNATGYSAGWIVGNNTGYLAGLAAGGGTGGGGSLGWGAILLVILIPSVIVVLVILGRKR